MINEEEWGLWKSISNKNLRRTGMWVLKSVTWSSGRWRDEHHWVTVKMKQWHWWGLKASRYREQTWEGWASSIILELLCTHKPPVWSSVLYYLLAYIQSSNMKMSLESECVGLPYIICLCVCMCVLYVFAYVHVYMLLYVNICAYLQRSEVNTSEVFIIHSLPYIWRKDLPLKLELTDHLNWLGSQSYGSILFCLHSSGIKCVSFLTWLFIWVLSTWTQVLMPHLRHLPSLHR